MSPRKLAVIVLFALLAFTGCKKISLPFGKKNPEIAGTPSPNGSAVATEATSAVPEPTKPDLTPATPKPAPKPTVDQTASVMVLCYHNIDEKGSKAMTIPVAEFEKEMQALKDGGFSVVPMQDFLAWRRGEKNIPHKSCVITLDDGWISAYTNAWPILKKFNYPFTLFIYINYVNTGGKSMTWDQLAEMRDAGVDIQSHTYSHSNLRAPGTGVDKHTADLVRKDIATLGKEGWLRKEIVESKLALEQRLGIKVNAIAYPFGNFTAEARDFVKQAGYEAAFTVYGQRISMHSPAYDLLGRYAVELSQPKIFADALAMIGGGAGAPEPAASSTVGQLAVTSMVTQPMNNETITNATPTIKVNLSTMGEIEAGSVELRVSGVGQLPVDFNQQTKLMMAQVRQPLKPGSYTVIVAARVGGQRVETRWDFSVAGPGGVVPGGLPSATPIQATVPAAPAHAGKAPATPARKKKN